MLVLAPAVPALFIAPTRCLWRLCLPTLHSSTMTSLRRSARISQRASVTTQSIDPTPPNNTRKRNRQPPAGLFEQDQSPEEGILSQSSLPLSSQTTVPTPTASLDYDTEQQMESQSQDLKVVKPRKKKRKAPPSPIYPPKMSRPYGTPRETLRIVTWNVASLRSVMRSGAFMAYITRERPDILCVQETKMTEEAMAEIEDCDEYLVYWNHSKRKGYSGVAVYVRKDLDRLGISIARVEHGYSEEVASSEGRISTLFLSNGVALVNAYVPNSGAKLARLGYRTEKFEPTMREYLNELTRNWGVIYTGDLNCAHEVIDIHNSKGNEKSAGHTPEERAAFSQLLKSGDGWADSWRRFYPQYSGFTYYSRRFGDRLKKDGKGWRLDYFLVDEKTFRRGVVKDIFLRPEVEGSDHYPLVIDFKLR